MHSKIAKDKDNERHKQQRIFYDSRLRRRCQAGAQHQLRRQRAHPRNTQHGVVSRRRLARLARTYGKYQHGQRHPQPAKHHLRHLRTEEGRHRNALHFRPLRRRRAGQAGARHRSSGTDQRGDSHRARLGALQAGDDYRIYTFLHWHCTQPSRTVRRHRQLGVQHCHRRPAEAHHQLYPAERGHPRRGPLLHREHQQQHHPAQLYLLRAVLPRQRENQHAQGRLHAGARHHGAQSAQPRHAAARTEAEHPHTNTPRPRRAAERILPAAADTQHQGRAGQRRGDSRAERAESQSQEEEMEQGDCRLLQQGDGEARRAQPAKPRLQHADTVSQDDGRPAVERIHQGRPQHRQGAEDSGQRPLRHGEGEGAHPRTHGRAQPQRRPEVAYHLPVRPSRSG